jgi:hypothetical protein
MGRQKKKLADFVRGKTFLARRHAHLLVTDPLVLDLHLREVQEAYQAETDTYARRRIALEFEKRVRETDEDRAWRLAAVPLDPKVEKLLKGPGRPRKSLLELVLSGGFHPWRHEQLLGGELLPAEPPLEEADHHWQQLRELQIAYQQDDPSVAYSPEQIRWFIAQDFRRAVRDFDYVKRKYEDRGESS